MIGRNNIRKNFKVSTSWNYIIYYTFMFYDVKDQTSYLLEVALQKL